MRRVRYNVAISLDGFIAPPNGSTNWIVHDDTIDFISLFAEFDKFVMGRKTYEHLLSQGPQQNPMNGKPREDVIIVSHEMKKREHEYPAVTVIDDDVAGYVAGLKKKTDKEGRDIWLFGGGELARSLLEAGVVDTVETATMPVVLGRGVKMIAAGGSVAGGEAEEQTWKLKLDRMERLEKSDILMCKYSVCYD